MLIYQFTSTRSFEPFSLFFRNIYFQKFPGFMVVLGQLYSFLVIRWSVSVKFKGYPKDQKFKSQNGNPLNKALSIKFCCQSRSNYYVCVASLAVLKMSGAHFVEVT